MTAIAYHVRQHGEFLATRAKAATIRADVEASLARLPDEWGLALDFNGVEAIAGAFADELVATLVQQHGDRVTVTGANDDVAEVIQLAISRRTERPAGKP